VGPLPHKTKEETTYNGVNAGDVGALTNLGTLAPSGRKRRIMVIHLGRLAPYEGTARDEQRYGGSSGSSWRVNTVQTEPQGGR
jgi:hypothetical protein